MSFAYDDGGREAAGFPAGKRRDCVTRAAAIASDRPYAEVHALVDALGAQERRTKRRSRGKSSAESGVYKATTRKLMEALGGKWTATMGIGTGCRVHLDPAELPMGRLAVEVSLHVVAVIDGVVRDTYDPTREGTRCVYGYWTFEARI